MSSRLVGIQRTRTPQGGFTLLELLAVLGIVALVTTSAALSFRKQGDVVRLRPLAAQIASELRMARSAAIASNRPVAFVLDARTRAYRIEGVRSAVPVPPSVGLRVTTARASETPTAEARLEFYPDGSSTGGRVTISQAGASIVVDVEWLTGAVLMRGGAG